MNGSKESNAVFNGKGNGYVIRDKGKNKLLMKSGEYGISE